MSARQAYQVRDLIPEGYLAQAIVGPLAEAFVSDLQYDSRRVKPGDLFFAFRGQRVDARQFAPEAWARGAVAVVAEGPRPAHLDGPWIQVHDARRALAAACRRFYARTVEALTLVGITGTNGKTTTAFLVDSILRAAGLRTALIGTIEYTIAGQSQPAWNTTPESLDLYRIFEQLVKVGGTHVTMEVSSHALAQGRVHQLPIRVGVFTNLTQDHLDFHGTLEQYFQAKSLMFSGQEVPPLETAVLNRDDPWAHRLNIPDQTRVVWYGVNRNTSLRGRIERIEPSGTKLAIRWNGKEVGLTTPLIGKPNAYNILAAFGVALSLEIPIEAIVQGIEQCPPVPGRLEPIRVGQPFLVVVDYAHTEDALRSLLETVRQITRGRVITVFGCGGDRDRTKRPLMGAAAAQGSDFVVVTSDNPRTEDPLRIINDILVGLRRYDVRHRIEPDRRTAIRLALEEARAGDTVVIAGKGHETYQIIGDQKIPFDDRQVARELLREMGYGGSGT